MSGRGGRRPGAGRPKGARSVEKPRTTVSVALEPALLAAVDERVREAGVSRSAWVSDALRRALRQRR